METARRLITYVSAWGPAGGGTIGYLDGGWGPAEGSRGRELASQLGAHVAQATGALWNVRPCESDYELDWEVVWGLSEAGEVQWHWWATLCPMAVTRAGAREVQLEDVVGRVCRMMAPRLAARDGASGLPVRVLRLEQAAPQPCPPAPVPQAAPVLQAAAVTPAGLQTEAAEAALEMRVAKLRLGLAARVQVWWGRKKEKGED